MRLVALLQVLLSIVAAQGGQIVELTSEVKCVEGVLSCIVQSAGQEVEHILVLSTPGGGKVPKGGKAGKGAGACPVLNLQLGAISLNVLGLDIETSKICLAITAQANQGLLGELLCDLANAVQLGNLAGFLNGLPAGDLALLLDALTDLIDQVLADLTGGLAAASLPTRRTSCNILHLTLGPVDLNILGLDVHLDNCNNGAVTADIKGVTGALLGDLLCDLANLDLTLAQVLDILTGLTSALASPASLLALANLLAGILPSGLDLGELTSLTTLLTSLLGGLGGGNRRQYMVVGGAFLGVPLGLAAATLFVVNRKRKEGLAHEPVPQIPQDVMVEA